MPRSTYQLQIKDRLAVTITETYSFHHSRKSIDRQLIFRANLQNIPATENISKNPLIQKLLAYFNIYIGKIKVISHSDKNIEIVITDMRNDGIVWRLLITRDSGQADKKTLGNVLKDLIEELLPHFSKIRHYKKPQWRQLFQVTTQGLEEETYDPKTQAMLFLYNDCEKYLEFKSMFCDLVDMLEKIYRDRYTKGLDIKLDGDPLSQLSKEIAILEKKDVVFREQANDLLHRVPELCRLYTLVGANIKKHSGVQGELRGSFLYKLMGESVMRKLNLSNPILDLGAGFGQEAVFFSKSGFNVTAVDCSTRAKHVFESHYASEDRERIDYLLMDLSDQSLTLYLEDLVKSHLYIISICTLKFLDPKSCESLLYTVINHALVGARIIFVNDIPPKSINPTNISMVHNGIASFFAPRIDWIDDRPNGWKDQAHYQLSVFEKVSTLK